MNYRLLAVPIVGAIAVLGGFLVYGNLNNNLVYYLTPAEAVASKTEVGDQERFRLGGFVEKGSVVRSDSGVSFTVVSEGVEVPVVHSGAPSQLFTAGIGVIVEGSWVGEEFRSDTLMVKHDEEYRAPDSARPDADQREDAR